MTSIPTIHDPFPATTTPLVSLYRYVEDIRTQNSALDAEIWDVLAQLPASHLHDQDTDLRRTVAEQVSHLAEATSFVAGQLESWLAGRRAVLGRYTPNDADFQDALLHAADLDTVTLHADIEQAQARLRNLLLSLRDTHLQATVEHVRHGREPLVLLLVRDVLTHKQRHVDELVMTACLLGTEP